MSLGQNIKRLRGNLGWTQGDLSNETGIKVAHISKLENNEGDPKLSTIQKLITAFNCDADELLFNKKESGLSSVLNHYLKKAMYLPAKDKAIMIEVLERFFLADSLREIEKERIPSGIWESLDDESRFNEELFKSMVESEADNERNELRTRPTDKIGNNVDSLKTKDFMMRNANYEETNYGENKKN